MIPPASILTPPLAANVLQLAQAVNSTARLNILLFMLAHPGPHTSRSVAHHLGAKPFITWCHLKRLVEIGAVVVAGKAHARHATGAKCHLFSVADNSKEAAPC